MSDEQTTPVASTPSPEPTPSGQSAPVEDSKSSVDVPSEPTEPTPSEALPSGKEAAPKKGKVNLYELPEFREYQSVVTKRQQELERQVQETAARERQEKLARMNDYEKQKFLAAEAAQRAEAAEQRLQYLQMLQQRAEDIDKLSKETGAPKEILEGADSFIEASLLAAKWVSENADRMVKEKVKAALTAQQANKPDMGGGATKSPQSARDEALLGARASRNAKDFVKAIMMVDEE